MGEQPISDVLITDVTLREYGQNVPASSLRFFSPQIRIHIASRLIEAGFRSLEVLSCVHPRISPAMDENNIRTVARGIGRMDHVSFVTLVPNRGGYKTFLSAGLGPEGYNHSLGIFFSAVEAHNRLNLGRSIRDTLEEYKAVVKDALWRRIRVAGYISAAFGYRPAPSKEVITPGIEELGAYLDTLLEMGASSVTLSDLQGVAGEEETRSVFEHLFKNRNKEVRERTGYHPHHVHKEKALANSRVAYAAGLRRFDASLGGTGGCVTGAPGNQPTEGLVALFENMGVRTGIDMQEVVEIGRFVEKELYTRISLERAE